MPHAARHAVGFRPGVRFSSRGELNNYLRLSFAFYEPEELAEGTRRLAQAVEDYANSR
jgi:DNA-binding transcriptional MocR family regulator